MKVDLFTLCNYVSNNEGRLTIVDTFEDLNADKFPWRAYFGVAIKMNIPKEEVHNKELKMYICKNDDMERHIFDVAIPINESTKGKLVLAGNIKGLIFDNEGTYHYIIATNEMIVFDYKFNVIKKGKINE